MTSKRFWQGYSYFVGIMAICVGCLMWGCSKDMEEQPSFSFQEAPRLQSPQRSIPRTGPWYARTSTGKIADGSHLFSINCTHCHGPQGNGDGPVAGYLPELPPNLHAPAIQQKSDAVLYGIVTKGEKVMPAFETFLSAEERWAVVSFLRSLVGHTLSSTPLTQESNQSG